MKGIKVVLLLLLVLMITGCKVKKYEIEINTSDIFETDNKEHMEITFELKEEKEIHINLESSDMISASLLDSSGKEIDSDTPIEANYEHYITFKETLDKGSYTIELEVRKTEIGEIDLHLYEVQTTTYDMDIDFELNEYHYPGETIEVNFEIDEAGFYDLRSGFGYGYAGKLDLYGVTESNPELHLELYSSNHNLYLEPGDYKLELTHWREYSNGVYYISIKEEHSMFGDLFSANKVSGSIADGSSTYHLLTVEEPGIYEVLSDSDFVLGFKCNATLATQGDSNLNQLNGVTHTTYSSAFRDNNKVYIELFPGNYLFSVYGIGTDEYGDYTLELVKTSITENTELVNEGTAYEMVDYGEIYKPTSTITLEITEAGNYTVRYQGTFTPSLEMYNILDVNEKYKYFFFEDYVYTGYFEVGNYVLNVKPYYVHGNGLNKVIIFKNED